jgi:PAS domain S-box-containing protein
MTNPIEAPGPEPAQSHPSSAPLPGDTDGTRASEEMQRGDTPAKRDCAFLTERHRPLRFLWQIDADGRFTLASAEFADLMGAPTLAQLGRTWREIAAALGLDPDGRVEHAIASRETWNGIRLAWPLGRGERVTVELSGVPVFDRDRSFHGYRGFGICRDVARLAAADAPRPAADHAPDAQGTSGIEPAAAGPRVAVVASTGNVLPSSTVDTQEERPALTAVEQSAFREIARALTSGLPGLAEQEAPPEIGAPAERAEALGSNSAVPSAFAPGATANGDAAISACERSESAEEAALRAETQARELRSILDTATDGVLVLERDGRIVSLNRSAEALFGYDNHELSGRPFAELFAPESRRAALDYLEGLSLNGVASVLNDGREVIGRVREGGLIPLFMTMGSIAGGGKFCAVLRDITQWKRAEEDLLSAKHEAERASSAKSDFLAKISHEIRTPLNAIIGFSEVMVDERFGPIGNERYRQYLKDIHASGGHLVSLLNDLLDLSKIEAGKLDLSFASVDLTALSQQCVALMQPQANRERILIRTSLLPELPAIVGDERSIRQIVLNLLSNAIKFTGAGGQVIVSTMLTERGEAVLRVRDTGIGLSETEIETALEPFRQIATSTRSGSGGTGLGLPLTKALAEANRASFAIKSAVNAGTSVEITFPATRVLAE